MVFSPTILVFWLWSSLLVAQGTAPKAAIDDHPDAGAASAVCPEDQSPEQLLAACCTQVEAGKAAGPALAADRLQRLLATYRVLVGQSVPTSAAHLSRLLAGARRDGSGEVRLQRLQDGQCFWLSLSWAPQVAVRRLEAVELEVLSEGVGYARYRTCEPGSAVRLAELIDAHKPLRALVIDLRGNPGGHLLEGAILAGFWLGPDVPVAELFASMDDLQAHTVLMTMSTRGPVRYRMPVAFVTDAQTASTAEAIVAMFRAHKLGASVGQRTKGDALATVFLDSDGHRATRQAMVTVPGLEFYHNIGLAPDIEIPCGSADAAASAGDFRKQCLHACMEKLADRGASTLTSERRPE